MLIKEDVRITPFRLKRTLHIYLPDDLKEGERVPVIYMFDGHNLFLDEDATYGTSWGLSEDLALFGKKIMIVGIECNHKNNQRLFEFSPYIFIDPSFGKIKGKGKTLFKWIVEELKPYIDNKYPTLSSREFTSIGGSSMGGLMALYGGIAHSNTFSKALCLSPYVYHCTKSILADIKKYQIHDNTSFYLSFGSEEVRGKRDLVYYIDRLFAIERDLCEKALVKMYIYKNHKHCEAAWRKETKTWLKDLHY